MICEFDYCVYNRNKQCLLKEIRINSLGMCDDCIVVSVQDSILEKFKTEQLHKLERR